MKALLIILMLVSSLAFNNVSAAPQTDEKQRAVETALHKFPGRVLSVKRHNDMYQVKILNDRGDVRIIKVPAKREQSPARR